MPPDSPAADLARRFGLQRLPGEGGLFRRTHIDAQSSAILYLLTDGDFSALHRLRGTEVWHFHAGAPVRLLLLKSDGTVAELVLDALTCPQLVVPGGVWQGAASEGAWSLVGTTMSPPYADKDFELGDRSRLVSGWPQAAERIRALTR